jgi:hypothetical protein
MANTLHTQVSHLAASFAESVLAAIRTASLEELLAESGATRGPARALRTPAPAVANRISPVRRAGRLARRSPEQIAKTVEQVVTLVKKHKMGLRAEQIRAQLGLQAKEMPRVLKDGLAAKKLTSKGQKRATTYFVR